MVQKVQKFKMILAGCYTFCNSPSCVHQVAQNRNDTQCCSWVAINSISSRSPGSIALSNPSHLQEHSVLACPVCCDDYQTVGQKRPMSLKCGHTFCQGGEKCLLVEGLFGAEGGTGTSPPSTVLVTPPPPPPSPLPPPPSPYEKYYMSYLKLRTTQRR